MLRYGFLPDDGREDVSSLFWSRYGLKEKGDWGLAHVCPYHGATGQKALDDNAMTNARYQLLGLPSWPVIPTEWRDAWNW